MSETDLQPLSPEAGIDRFLEHYEPSVREGTFRKAKSRLGFFLEWCEELEIENLNELDGRKLADFVSWRRSDDIAAITLQKQLGTIRVALRYWDDIEAVRDGLAEQIHSPQVPDGSRARDVHLDHDRAESILSYLDEHRYASREHVILGLLWRTGMRRSALHSLDVDDLRPDEHAVRVEHRPETGTKLKNGESGERWVFLGPVWYNVVDSYVADVRDDKTDDYGREPLLTTRGGRPHETTIYKWVNRITHPCEYGECPHDRTPETCEARDGDSSPSKCPSARSPHAVRRGSITYHLNQGVSPDTVSERMDVSLGVLYDHYDARTPREKMAVRRQDLEGI